jgi:hypothetical protein
LLITAEAEAITTQKFNEANERMPDVRSAFGYSTK